MFYPGSNEDPESLIPPKRSQKNPKYIGYDIMQRERNTVPNTITSEFYPSRRPSWAWKKLGIRDENFVVTAQGDRPPTLQPPKKIPTRP